MEDIVIPVLNSGIPEDELKPISSDSAPSATWYDTYCTLLASIILFIIDLIILFIQFQGVPYEVV